VNKNIPAKSPFSNLMQIGVVVRDLEEVTKRLSSLGIGPFEHSSPPPGAEGLFLYDKPLDIELKQLCTKIGDIELELIQPGEEESPWKDFLDSKGEGIQHLGFKVDDLKDVIAKLVKQGASVFVTGKARGRLQAAYVDLGVGDIIVELMEF